MKISELIIELQKMLLEHGDLPVAFYDEWHFQEITEVNFDDGLDFDGSVFEPESIHLE